MNTASITLYKALKDAGIEDNIARQVSEEVVTKDEAKHFASRADISELKSTLISWMFGLHLSTITVIVTLIQLLK